MRFRTRKHLALLIRLALEPGKRFTRDHLTDLLWPDVPRPRANHSLAQGLSVLKAKIGREAILLQRATVGLAPGVVDVDVTHLGNGDIDVSGPFLDGFEVPTRPFEDWKDEWRAKLLPEVRDCLVRQMDAGRRIGDFETVERRARRLQELDPLAEEAVRGIVEARAWAGDRSNALQAFARYEAALAEELGAKPGVDLVRMADLLRDGRRARPRTTAAPVPLAARRFEPETLIGREREFSVLYDAWIEARRKAPRIVVMTGDAGVGKTTLANAFVSSCQMDGAVVARAQAYDAERELPFVVLGELVRQLAAQRAIGSADPEALSELTRVTGEILRQFPGVPKPVEWSPEITPLRLADAFLKVITAAAEDGPVVLVVDDLHAADAASTGILHMVARKLAELRLLVIFTGRTSELRLSGVPAALAADTAIEGMRALELDVLAPEAAEALVGRLVATVERADPPTERILRTSNGNPLAIELLTREWAAHGPESLLRDLEALDTQPLPSIGIPRAIGVVFERQVQRLDTETRAALNLAALLGRRLTDLQLYSAVELPPGRAAAALSRLKEEGLLREVRGDLEFRNELIRAQAYYAVAGAVRQQLHKHLAALLTKRPGAEDDAAGFEVAWHYVRSGNPHLALPFVERTVEGAIRVGGATEGQRLLETLLEHSATQTRSRQLRLLLAKATLAQSKARLALEHIDTLSGDPLNTPHEAAQIALLRVVAASLMGSETGTAYRAASDRSVALAQRVGDPALIAQALYEGARAACYFGDALHLRTVHESIEDLYAQSEAKAVPVTELASAFTHFHLGQPRTAATHLDAYIALLRGARDTDGLATAYAARGISSYVLCDFDEANRFLEDALDLARRIGDDSRASRIATNLSTVEATRGRFANAIEYGTLSLALGRRNPCQPILGLAYTNLADAYFLTGDQASADNVLRDAATWVAEGWNWTSRIAFMCECASAALLQRNAPLVLQLTNEIETLAAGRESLVPHQGMMLKLEAFKAVHASKSRDALEVAVGKARDWRERLPIYYLDALAVTAWLEGLTTGSQSPNTRDAIQSFDKVGAFGKLRLLQAQGFLT